MNSYKNTSVIESAQNPLIKKAASLRDKKYRQQHGLFAAEGQRTIGAAIESGLYEIDCLLFDESASRETGALKKSAMAKKIKCVTVASKVMQKLSQQDNAQNIIGLIRHKYADAGKILSSAKTCVIALESPRDPGNLGTIIRTADAMAIDGIILIGDSCDPFAPECVRATMDSIFHIPLARSTVADFIKQNKLPTIGTALQGAKDFREVSYKPPFALVMGSEQKGLSGELAKSCDHLAKLPIPGKAESLNLSVATGVMLYAALAPWRK